MSDIILRDRDGLTKHINLNTNDLKAIISAFKMIDIKKEFSINNYICIFHSAITQKDTTNYYQLQALQYKGIDSNFDFPINEPDNFLGNYYILNMTKGLYIQSDTITPLVLLCFKGNEYLAKPYRGICEELIGDWCGDAICIMEKSEAKSLIKTFENIFVYFDLEYLNG